MNFRALQKSWFLKLNDPHTQRALWLRFNFLFSTNGFKKIAETWAVFSHRDPIQDNAVKKFSIKKTYELQELSNSNPYENNTSFKIEECEFNSQYTRGVIQAKGHQIEWDLSIKSGQENSFQAFPDIFFRTGMIPSSISTPHEDLLCSGTLRVSGQEPILWKDAKGMIGTTFGSKYPPAWIWGQCNLFSDEQGNLATFLFEGVSVRTHFGPLTGPVLSSFFFHYRNQNFFFNHVREIISLKSKQTLNEWTFRADRGNLSFHGTVKAEHRDFVGLTYEDTNGSLLYATQSCLSTIEIHVYRTGKLEASFISRGSAAFEVVSREKNPYVDFLT